MALNSYPSFVVTVDTFKSPTNTLCLIFMILVSLENVKKYSHVAALLPQRLKSMLFEIFSTLQVPFGQVLFWGERHTVEDRELPIF